MEGAFVKDTDKRGNGAHDAVRDKDEGDDCEVDL